MSNDFTPPAGLILNPMGEKIVKRGGDKRLEKLDEVEADDTLLQMEILKRAPNISQEDHRDIFIALRMQYGEDALAAVREGYVQFELQSSRDMKEPVRRPEEEQ